MVKASDWSSGGPEFNTFSVCGGILGHVEYALFVGGLASVRADSSVVSWLNMRVTHQVQDTSLGIYQSPYLPPKTRLGTIQSGRFRVRANGQKQDIR